MSWGFVCFPWDRHVVRLFVSPAFRVETGNHARGRATPEPSFCEIGLFIHLRGLLHLRSFTFTVSLPRLSYSLQSFVYGASFEHRRFFFEGYRTSTIFTFTSTHSLSPNDRHTYDTKTNMKELTLLPLLAGLAAANSAGCGESGGNWYCQPIERVAYTGVGTTGSYQAVTGMDASTGACAMSPQSFSGAMAPLDEDVSSRVQRERSAGSDMA